MYICTVLGFCRSPTRSVRSKCDLSRLRNLIWQVNLICLRLISYTRITVSKISELFKVVTNTWSFSFLRDGYAMYRISLCEQLFSPSPWWGRGGGWGELVKSAYQLSACLNGHPILPKRSFIWNAFSFQVMAIKKFITNLTQNLRRDCPGNTQNGEGIVRDVIKCQTSAKLTSWENGFADIDLTCSRNFFLGGSSV